jgi:hypothetical protein
MAAATSAATGRSHGVDFLTHAEVETGEESGIVVVLWDSYQHLDTSTYCGNPLV